jgi:hypothetical protein
MKSYNDLNYRTYVLNQFKIKKSKIENIILKHQEELKILEETMENIKDGMVCLNSRNRVKTKFVFI